MRWLLLILINFLCLNQVRANYHATEINFEYNKNKNRVYVQMRYWRLCNTPPDPLMDEIRVDMPGCGSFVLPVHNTSITDKSLFKHRYPTQACLNPNNTSSSSARGVEEFFGEASFALDTAPFVNAAQNGCCKIYFSMNGIFIRPQGTTTGVTGLLYNYAMMDICNILAAKKKIYRSPNFMLPHHSEYLACNQTSSIDYGLDEADSDSVNCLMAPALDSGRTNQILPSSPLTYQIPIHTYCPLGFSKPCTPIPFANPAIGFYINPSNGGLFFTPTAIANKRCEEQGVATIHVNGFLKDSMGNMKLTSIIRRDFIINVINSHKNNPPSLKGVSEYFLTEGDSIYAEVASNDVPVVVPPPGSSQKPDSTEFIIKTNYHGLKVNVVDSNVRERKLSFSLKVDSAVAAQKTITAAVIIHDQDSLYPGRNSYSYRFHIAKKVKLHLKVSSLDCGLVKVKIDGDSLNLARLSNLPAKVKMIQNGIRSFHTVTTDSTLIQLKDTGVCYFALENTVPNKEFKLVADTTITYQKTLISAIPSSTYSIICEPMESKVLSTQFLYTGQDSVKHQWYKGQQFIGFDKDLHLITKGQYKSVIAASGCSDSLTFTVDSFENGNALSSKIPLCENTCDTINPVLFSRHPYNAIYTKWLNNGSHDSLAASGLLSCNLGLHNALKSKDTLIVFSKKNFFSSCLNWDTLLLNYKRKVIGFKDTSICPQGDLMALRSLSSNPQIYDSTVLYFKDLGTHHTLDSIVDQPSPRYFFNKNVNAGSYNIESTEVKDNCYFKDSFNIEVKANAYNGNDLIFNHQFCQGSLPYPLNRITQNDSFNFELRSINNVLFNGNQNDYLSSTAFVNTNQAGIFQLAAQKPLANGCLTDTAVLLVVLAKPNLNLGPDFNVNPDSYVRLFAPYNMQSYQWSIPGQNNNIVQGKAKNLGLTEGENIVECTVIDTNGCIAKDAVVITYSNSVNLQSPALHQLELYPNPCQGVLHIKSESAIQEVTIHSSSGQLLVRRAFDSPQKSIALAPLYLVSGQYIIRIKTELGTSNHLHSFISR
jgi:hypothetical protein